jgi:putative tryptophan/tyrosine transport system substrate-binding protein
MNQRRKLLAALGLCALAAPLRAFAQQQGKVWRVGFLSLQRRPDSFDSVANGGFSLGMRELGYVEGKNLALERRFADGKVERLPGLATELVKMKVDVIVTVGPQTASAAQKATTTIPIVMAIVNDPVGSGFVKSLAHPGGNITGLSNITGETGPKHLEMLIGMVPKLSRVAVLVNPTNSGHTTALKNVQAAAQRINVKIMPMEARSPQEIENAFSTMARQNTGAVIVLNDSVFVQQRRQIAELARKHRLPSISANREYAEAGCLLSYGYNPADLLRHAATYVDKILKGAKPRDLPVEQPTKFELFINGKTAKALGLTIPQSLLISADKVIE